MRDATLGDTTFEELYAREAQSMLRLAGLILGNRSEAEEVVQEAFFAVSQRWDDVSNVGGYLRTSVLNGSNMVLRRRRTADRRDDREVVELVADRQETVELLDALRSLSAKQRLAIVLRYYLVLTDEEIAGQLGCRPSTVRSHLRRGLRTLRKELS